MTLKNLVVLAGLACAGSAFANPGVVNPTRLPAGLPLKHAYYNYATGELVVDGVVSRSDPVWGFGGANYSGFYYPTDNGTGTGGSQGNICWDEGVLDADATFDTFDITYYAGGGTPDDGTQTGDLFMGFSDVYATCGGEAAEVALYGITGLPMNGSNGWIITIDLTGVEFSLTAGHQFSYDSSWDLTNGPLVTNLGMYIVNPAIEAPGTEDAFQETGPTGPGCWFFGGWDPTDNNPPYAQFHITMYGVAGPTGCPADFDGDGTVDFFDYDAYVNCFEGIVCPPGKDADFDGDGTADFFDYDAFVVAFET
ncbi:MAG: hypothetical protein AABZ53_06745, partial [Planctomycetota bacterium]